MKDAFKFINGTSINTYVTNAKVVATASSDDWTPGQKLKGPTQTLAG
jgi:hypothetical protein